MNTIILNKKNIFIGNLLLVNAKYPLKSSPEKELTSVDTKASDILLKRHVANVLQLVLDKISAGDSIIPVSGYRSAEEQTEIYEDSLKSNGKDYTRKFVALPHHSEHQTGLAIDLGLNKENIDFICPDFPYTGVCDEFRRASCHYGFIERYPSGKEEITGIAHEPWHFRYVGYPHSEIMNEKGLTLEEYIDFLKKYPRDGKHLTTCRNGRTIEIFYAAAGTPETTTLVLPCKTLYQVSGNNSDGYIVTLWRNGNE